MRPQDTITNCDQCGTELTNIHRRAKQGPTRFCSVACHYNWSRSDAVTADRFWKLVDKSGDCWLWQGHKGRGGYGVSSRRSYPIYAHRLSYILAHGSIPNGLIICHKCDVPACVRPEHLFAATYRENTLDARVKGRLATGVRAGMNTKPLSRPKGERNGWSKLTEDDVRAIRLLRGQGVLLKVLAAQFNTTLTNISLIALRRSWQHVE